MARSIAELEGKVEALFSDLDGTLTTDGRLEASTLAAIEQLDEAGIPFFVVTGRSAGWGQALLAMLPARGVVAENGGVTFVRTADRIDKYYALPAGELGEWRQRMQCAVAELSALIEGARLSSDSCYREVDLAIDWNEEATLSSADADRLVELLTARGFTATRSSVHVNFAPPLFDKLSACRELVSRVQVGDGDLANYIYVGDALNDAPMFAGFPRSVGVANIVELWDELEHRPAYLTASAQGKGVRELITRVLELGG